MIAWDDLNLGYKYVSPELLIWIMPSKVLGTVKDRDIPDWNELTNDGERFVDQEDGKDLESFNREYESWVAQGWWPKPTYLNKWGVTVVYRPKQAYFEATFDTPNEAKKMMEQAIPKLLASRRPPWLLPVSLNDLGSVPRVATGNPHLMTTLRDIALQFMHFNKIEVHSELMALENGDTKKQPFLEKKLPVLVATAMMDFCADVVNDVLGKPEGQFTRSQRLLKYPKGIPLADAEYFIDVTDDEHLKMASQAIFSLVRENMEGSIKLANRTLDFRLVELAAKLAVPILLAHDGKAVADLNNKLRNPTTAKLPFMEGTLPKWLLEMMQELCVDAVAGNLNNGEGDFIFEDPGITLEEASYYKKASQNLREAIVKSAIDRAVQIYFKDRWTFRVASQDELVRLLDSLAEDYVGSNIKPQAEDMLDNMLDWCGDVVAQGRTAYWPRSITVEVATSFLNLSGDAQQALVKKAMAKATQGSNTVKLANADWGKLFPAKSFLNLFFSEKEIPERTFTKVDSTGVTHMIPNGVVVEYIALTKGAERAEIENILRKIDFKNGNVNHFLEHLAGAIAEQYSGSLRFASLEEDLAMFKRQHPYHSDLDLIGSQRRTTIGDGDFRVSQKNALVLERAGLVSIIGGRFGDELHLTEKGLDYLSNSKDTLSKFAKQAATGPDPIGRGWRQGVYMGSEYWIWDSGGWKFTVTTSLINPGKHGYRMQVKLPTGAQYFSPPINSQETLFQQAATIYADPAKMPAWPKIASTTGPDPSGRGWVYQLTSNSSYGMSYWYWKAPKGDALDSLTILRESDDDLWARLKKNPKDNRNPLYWLSSKMSDGTVQKAVTLKAESSEEAFVEVSKMYAQQKRKRKVATTAAKVENPLRQRVNASLVKAGLDGNGRFRTPVEGYSKAIDILSEYGIEMDTVVSSHLFNARPSGVVNVELAYTNPEDAFSPISIGNTVLHLQFTELRKDVFEMIGYLS